MTLTLDGAAFRREMAWLAKALPTKPVQPGANAARLTVAAGRLVLAVWDHQTAARSSVRAGGEGWEGARAVSGPLLAALAQVTPADVALELTPAGVALRSGRVRACLPVLPDELVSAAPEPGPPAGQARAEDLSRALGAAVKFASQDTASAGPLAHVQVVSEAGALWAQATDRYKLCRLPAGPWAGPDVNLLVPAGVAALLKGADGECALAPAGPIASFTAGTRQVGFATPAGPYPDVRRLLAPLSGHRIVCRARELAEAVKIAAAAGVSGPSQGQLVTLALADAKVTVKGAGDAGAESEMDLDCENTAPGVARVVFNTSHLLPVLSAVTDAMIALQPARLSPDPQTCPWLMRGLLEDGTPSEAQLTAVPVSAAGRA
jgi:DNA polymerase-3 subunit beta